MIFSSNSHRILLNFAYLHTRINPFIRPSDWPNPAPRDQDITNEVQDGDKWLPFIYQLI